MNSKKGQEEIFKLKKREKGMKRTKQYKRHTGHHHTPNVSSLGAQVGQRENGAEATLEERMFENFPKLIRKKRKKKINLLIKKTKQTASRINTKKITPRHVTGRLLKKPKTKI